MIKKHGPLILEYNKITDKIFLGTNQCCQIHFNNRLLKKGVTADISLEGEKLDKPFGISYYLWLPTKDHNAPTQKQLRVGVKAINNFLDEGAKIYVHCRRGHGRAPTLVAAYLIYKGMEVEEAISFIKKKRPDIHPNYKQKAALRKFKLNLS